MADTPRPDIEGLVETYNQYVRLVNKAHDGEDLTDNEEAQALALLRETHAAFPALAKYAFDIEARLKTMTAIAAEPSHIVPLPDGDYIVMHMTAPEHVVFTSVRGDYANEKCWGQRITNKWAAFLEARDGKPRTRTVTMVEDHGPMGTDTDDDAADVPFAVSDVVVPFMADFDLKAPILLTVERIESIDCIHCVHRATGKMYVSGASSFRLATAEDVERLRDASGEVTSK